MTTSEDPAVTSDPEPRATPPEPAPPTGRWSERLPARAALVYGLSYLALAAGGGKLAAVLPASFLLPVVVTVVGLTCTILSLLLVLSVCRTPLKARVQALLLVVTTIVFLLARPEVTLSLARWWHLPPRLVAHMLLSGFPGDTLVGNLALILWAAWMGKWVAGIIREGNLLLPVAVAASLMDIATVFWGFVAKASETAPKVVAALSAQAPAAEVMQAHNLPVPILTYVGIGDFLFLAVFLTAALRHRMRPAATMWAAFIAMLVAAPVVALSPTYGIPGLPFLSAGALIVNWRYFHFTREEKRALTIVGGLVVALIGAGVVLLLRRG